MFIIVTKILQKFSIRLRKSQLKPFTFAGKVLILLNILNASYILQIKNIKMHFS